MPNAQDLKFIQKPKTVNSNIMEYCRRHLYTFTCQRNVIAMQIGPLKAPVDDPNISTSRLCSLVWAADGAGDRGPSSDVHCCLLK